jgi:integrase
MKKPKFVHGYIDRHGKPRFYLRREGEKNVALPGLPWSPEFMAAYQAAMNGHAMAGPVTARGQVGPGTLRALAISYFSSMQFRSLKATTQTGYRNIIERLCKDHGDKRAALIQREHIIKLMADIGDRPEAANRLRKVLRSMMTHAVEAGLRKDDPTRDVRALKIKSDGYHSWTDDEIAQFEAKHAIGTRARLAMALLLYTGQRRSDVVSMGCQHIQDGKISVRQHKTGAKLKIPLHRNLAAILDVTPSGHLAFLTTQFGKPFTAAGFGNWFRHQCNEARLPHVSAHGLRKAASRRLAEAGCTAHEIAAITGHASLREITRYTKAADQERLAVAAMNKVRTSNG